LIKKVSQAKAFYLSLRIWIDNEEINTYINDFLCKKLSVDDLSKLGSNVFMCYDKEFEWPSLEGEYLGNKGKCLGTKSHIAILSNGDVVPCCLDGNGVMVLGNVYNDKNSKEKMSVRGRDLVSGLPKTITITEQEITEALKESAMLIVNTVKSVLEQTPPELSADIIDNGIVLTGGGALIKGMDKLLGNELKVPIRIAESPLTCVVEGAGVLLENINLIDK